MTHSPIAAAPAKAGFGKHHVYLWVDAIRQAYMGLLPLTVVGALCVAINQALLSLSANWSGGFASAQWDGMFNVAISATMGVTGLLGAMSIATRLGALLPSAVRGGDSASNITGGAVAGAAFLMVVLSTQSPSFSSLGYSSIFQSMVVGIASAELMAFFERKIQLQSDLGDLESGIALHRSLNLTACGFATLATIGAATWVASEAIAFLLELGQWLFADVTINQYFSALWLNPLMVVVNQALWLVGVNGGQVLLHLSTLNQSLFAGVQTLYQSDAASPMFVNAFAHLGGAGSTLGLIAYCLLKIKDESMRRLAWFSLLPAMLNVNELLLFGIPLVFGRTMAVPFVMVPLINCVVATLCVQSGLLPMAGEAVAWSTPIFLSGYLMSQSPLGALLQLLLLGSSALLYGPYLERMQEQREKANRAEFKNSLNQIMAPAAEQHATFTQTSGVVGDTARLLVRDFARDFNSDRIAVFYQPQHDGAGRIIGAEALLRWTHATHGPIPTQAIVNLAEESALILQLGRFVLARACQDIAQWRTQGVSGFSISVNVSPLQLEDPGWAGYVQATMAHHQIAAHEIIIELTEGQAVSSSEQADKSIFALQKQGLYLSMDDFGMGCTSLLYLHRFDIHEIKFDGVLSRGIESNPVAQDIVRCVSDLAHSQKAKVVAEFVETVEQRQILQKLGCDYFQGWLYSPAINAEKFAQYFTKHRNTAAPSSVVTEPQALPANPSPPVQDAVPPLASQLSGAAAT